MFRYHLIGLLLACSISQVFACSAFKYAREGQVIAAKNFDWFFGEGVLLQNNRDQSKCTYLAYEGQATCWTSRYGSITFNQNGKEFPYGGMNEAGLVVEMLWLKETQYAGAEEGVTLISELEWIQYQLDNFQSVEEVMAHLDQLAIDPITATIHYFVVDATGKSAVIEFINGEAVITESGEAVQTITNGTHAFNDGFYQRNKSKLGAVYIPHKTLSPLRYCSLLNNLQKRDPENEVDPTAAFETLAHVAEDKEGYKTYWTIVYDLTGKRIHFKTYDRQMVKQVALDDLNFDSGSTQYYDLLTPDSTSEILSQIDPYDAATNMKLIETCIKPKLSFNFPALNQHQLHPVRSRADTTFAHQHMDVTVRIFTKESEGAVSFFLADSETNFRRQGPYGSRVEIKGQETTHVLYSLPKGLYAYGAFHDVNNSGGLDRNFIKMPKEPYAFSGKKRFFFLPPKFKKARFELAEEVVIRIK
ncbi:MAG: DUF2141 domain-containing protein [Bacteroidota bacterium]